MQIYESTLQHRLVHLGNTEPLTKPKLFVDYMLGAFADNAEHESLWLISMNPKCRPISRTLLRTGPLVAAMTSPRDLFRVALQADANAIAVVRSEPGENLAMTAHDRSALKRFSEAARCLSIQFIDYLVIDPRADLDGPGFYSWRAAERP